MSENIIRKDIIQVGFDVDLGGLTTINKEMDNMHKSVSNGIDSGLSKINDGLKNVNKSAQALNSTRLDNLKKDIEAGGAAIEVAKEKFKQFKNSAKNGINAVTHPLKTLDKNFLSLQWKISQTTHEIKTMTKTKLSNLSTSLKNVKNTLTQGEKGAKGFVTMLKSIGKIGISKTISSIQKAKNGLNDTNSAGSKVKETLGKIAKTTVDKLNTGLNKVKSNLSSIASKAAGAAFTGLKKLASISFKTLVVGITGAVAAIGTLTAKSVQAYGDYEQLVGGVETLFGAKGAQSVKEYADIMGKSVNSVKSEYKTLKQVEKTVLSDANDAYKTAGLSANAYMETVTGFSASLISSLDGDTKKAATLANMAIVDMSDNANKMGTSMESIQYAYQGFAKQNYTIIFIYSPLYVRAYSERV